MSKVRIGVLLLALLAAVTACTSTKTGTASFSQPSCTGPSAISPSGSPYCFLGPPGVAKIPNPDLGSEQWPVEFKLSSGDAISAGVSAVDDGLAALSDSELLKDTNAGAQNLGNGIVLQSPNGELSKIPAGRAIHYLGALQVDGKKVNIDIYFVYGGKYQLNIDCYWTTAKALVQRTCNEALLSLHITSTT